MDRIHEIGELRRVLLNLNDLYHGKGIAEGLAQTSARWFVSEAIDNVADAIVKLENPNA
jgi:hypothetical protein